ncbi:hypothetical protein ACIA8E_13180 [Streptomyces sp. NPDC051664]|uniref:hypothetical protein n=1 Tax=Streptomyces sp. NPDC051664 TaxID=3365668 RepID=UPI0037BACCC8
MSVMVTHFSRGPVLDVITRLRRRLGATVVLQEGVALTLGGGRLGDLPEDLRMAAEVIDFSGAAIQAAIDVIARAATSADWLRTALTADAEPFGSHYRSWLAEVPQGVF